MPLADCIATEYYLIDDELQTITGMRALSTRDFSPNRWWTRTLCPPYIFCTYHNDFGRAGVI